MAAKKRRTQQERAEAWARDVANLDTKGRVYVCKARPGVPRHARGCITRQQLALRPRSARALRRAWHRGEQHPSALRRAALWWALEALRGYPSAADSEGAAANLRARAALAEVPRG